jgi:cytochrome P450 family 4
VVTLHGRKDIWGDDADKFNPDHFAPDVQRHPYGYLPFSGGSRICIGHKYANMSMVIVMAQLIRSYKFSTDLKMEELKFDFCITLRLINKHMVRAEKRSW